MKPESVHLPLEERPDDDLLLTTTQVAELLDVHASTVKRWCNGGELDFETTSGGHRRIQLGSALRAAREREISNFLTAFEPYTAHVWIAVRRAVDGKDFRRARSLLIGWLRRGRLERMRRLLYELSRHPGISLVRFCDGLVRPFMEEVGTAWSQGRLRVGDEHLASQAVLEVLLRLREDWRDEGLLVDAEGRRRPTAVVGAMDGVQHHLGALCIRLLLERQGWSVAYLGPNVPAEEFAAVQRVRGARLVCMSVAPPHTGADVQRAIRILSHFGHARKRYALVFGGEPCSDLDLQPEGTPFTALSCFTGAEPFRSWLSEHATTLTHEGS